MPFDTNYKVEEDAFYKEGLEKGLEKGKKIGLKEGLILSQDNTRKIIINLLSAEIMSIELISKAVNVSVEEVLKIKAAQ